MRQHGSRFAEGLHNTPVLVQLGGLRKVGESILVQVSRARMEAIIAMDHVWERSGLHSLSHRAPERKSSLDHHHWERSNRPALMEHLRPPQVAMRMMKYWRRVVDEGF